MFYCNTPNLGLNPSLIVLSQISRFWAVNCTKMRLAAGLRWESYSASPEPIAIGGGGGKGREGSAWIFVYGPPSNVDYASLSQDPDALCK